MLQAFVAYMCFPPPPSAKNFLKTVILSVFFTFWVITLPTPITDWIQSAPSLYRNAVSAPDIIFNLYYKYILEIYTLRTSCKFVISLQAKHGPFCPGTFLRSLYPGLLCPGPLCPGTLYPGKSRTTRQRATQQRTTRKRTTRQKVKSRTTRQNIFKTFIFSFSKGIQTLWRLNAFVHLDQIQAHLMRDTLTQ